MIYSGKTRYQSVEILDTGPFGRCLILDGKTQSAEADEYIYHESLVHPAFISHPNPVDIFIAGGGEGATLREVLAHSTVQKAVMVDLDQQLVKLCQRFLPNHHQGAFQDPRVRLHHTDAARFLEDSPEKFDIIIIDITDPLEGGPAYLLYTQNFYRTVLNRLNPQGILVAQAGSCDSVVYTKVFTSVLNTMSTVFPNVIPYSAYMASFGCMWGFAIASRELNPRELTGQEVDRRIASRVNRQLGYYDGETHKGIFHLPKYLRQEIANEKHIITEDNPVYAP